MLPQHSKAHMHTPILIFFTCIAKKQISKLHNIVLLHKKVEHVPKKIHLCTEIFRPPLYWSYMFTFGQLLWKKSIYLPLYIFFSFSKQILDGQIPDRPNQTWKDQDRAKHFCFFFYFASILIVISHATITHGNIFLGFLDYVMLIFVLTLHARTRKLYYYLMCRGMRRCD